jgi:hypothetical protein
MLQRFLPSGGSEQAKATTYASCLPVSLRLPPGRSDSLRACSNPPSTKRLRVRSTVEGLVCSALAMFLSVRSSSAKSRMWARFIFLARTSPLPTSFKSSDFSSFVRSTT